MNITGHTVFIPGATSGIGLALALRLQERGNTVIVGGRRTALIDEIVAAHPGIEGVEIDTSDPASIRAAAAQVTAAHPELDVLVTMAGIMRAEDWTATDEDALAGLLASAEQTVTTNVLGTIRLIAAFLPQLRTRQDATIVTVSSGLAFAPLRATPTYNATKAAVHMLSESLRLQFAETGARIVELVPPAVRTDLMPGHRDNAFAMPLDAFADEVMTILESEQEPREVLVDNVRFLRYGEARGDYDEVVVALNRDDPQAR